MSTPLPEELKADIHIIRQDYARALSAVEAFPGNHLAQTAFEEVRERRARAIRMIHEEDGYNVRELSALFRTSKTAVRDALGGEA